MTNYNKLIDAIGSPTGKYSAGVSLPSGYVPAPVVRVPSADEFSIAKYILTKSAVDFSWKPASTSSASGYGYASGTATATASRPGFKDLIGGAAKGFIDLASRGEYASAEAVRRTQGGALGLNPLGLMNPINIAKYLSSPKQLKSDVAGTVSGNIAGLTGKKKTLYSDMLKGTQVYKDFTKVIDKGSNAPWANFIRNTPFVPADIKALSTGKAPQWMKTAAKSTPLFAADIVGDPLNAVPAGASFKGAKWLKNLSKPKKAIAAGTDDVSEALGKFSRILPDSTVQSLLKAGVSPQQLTRAEDVVSAIAKDGDKAVRRFAPPKVATSVPLNAHLASLSKSIATQMSSASKTINPNIQVQMYSKFLKAANGSEDVARSMLKTAEKHLEDLGKLPEFWDGTKTRLSVILDDVGDSKLVVNELRNPKKIIDPIVANAVEKARAFGAVSDSGVVHTVLEQATRRAGIAASTVSDATRRAAMEGFKGEAKIVLNAAGASSAARKTTRELIDQIVKASDGPLQPMFRTHGPTLRAVADGKKVPMLTLKVARESMDHTIDKIKTVLNTAETTAEETATNGILARFAAWHGEKTIHPKVLRMRRSAHTMAKQRQNIVVGAFRGLSTDETEIVARAMKGAIPVEMLPDKLKTVYHVVDESFAKLLRTGVSPHNEALSVADRAMMAVEDINDMLDRRGIKHLRFKPDETGNWQNWHKLNFSEKFVATDILDVIDAIEHVSHRYGFFDELGSIFGTKKFKSGLVQVANPRLKGVYFDRKIAKEINHALRTMEEFYNPNSQFMRGIRDVTNVGKVLVTIPNPSHHINNFIGDAFFAFLKGVTDPSYYIDAMHILQSQRRRFNDITTIGELADPDALARSLQKHGGLPVLRWKGKEYTAEEVYIAAKKYGVLQDVKAQQDLATAGMSTKITERGGKANPLRFMSRVSENVSNETRLAHFMYEIKHSKLKNFEDAAKEAAEAVAKWHPDGMDLTKSEQAIRSLGIPFYSWLRKSTPLIFEGAILNPNRMRMPNVAAYAIQTARGEETSLQDPFNAGGLWPGWLVSPGTKGPVAAGRLPQTDLMNMLANPRSALGSLNPLIKGVYEGYTDRRIDTGTPIYDKKKHLLSQVPIASRVGSISRSDDPERGIINWATGANISAPDKPSDPWVKAEEKRKQAKVNKAIRTWAIKNRVRNPKTGKLPSEQGKLPKYVIEEWNKRGGE